MLTEMLMNDTALLTNTNPKADGVANHSLEDNWLDDVRFGWHDAIVGLYAVDGFRALGDLKTWLGDAPGAEAAYAIHTRAVSAYNAAYWDEGAGMYRDWVDATGRPRTYFYTWQNFYAVEAGVASPAQASAIMASADALYAGLRARLNVTAEALWCTPTNLIPLDPLDLTVDFDSEYVYPHYENGDCFQWHLGLEALALSRVRGAGAAYDKLARAAGVFDGSRLWGQRYSWTEGRPMGADVITERPTVRVNAGMYLLESHVVKAAMMASAHSTTRSRCTSTATTLAPSLARRCAIASPIPLAAPVTSATLP
jgi:hypothetical protein